MSATSKPGIRWPSKAAALFPRLRDVASTTNASWAAANGGSGRRGGGTARTQRFRRPSHSTFHSES
eukprot:6129146-Lingulodinium_polyedra.AAC.1